MKIEHSPSIEFRREGRILTGYALRYGDVSPTHRERFEPGAFAADLKVDRTRWMNVEHRQLQAIAWTGGGGLELRDTPEGLKVRAEIAATPAGERALRDVAMKALTGFSVEFHSQRERRDGLRIIEAAKVDGVALTNRPSYRQSLLELRRSSGRSMRARIPSGKRLGCRCSGRGCKTASFTDKAVKRMLSDVESNDRIIAAYKDYSNPLASVQRGTLRRAGDEIEIVIPDDEAGRAVLAAHESTGVVVRPYIDGEGMVETLPDGSLNMAYDDSIEIRAVIVAASDERQGWPEPRLVADEAAETRRRRIWL